MVSFDTSDDHSFFPIICVSISKIELHSSSKVFIQLRSIFRSTLAARSQHLKPVYRQSYADARTLCSCGFTIVPRLELGRSLLRHLSMSDAANDKANDLTVGSRGPQPQGTSTDLPGLLECDTTHERDTRTAHGTRSTKGHHRRTRVDLFSYIVRHWLSGYVIYVLATIRKSGDMSGTCGGHSPSTYCC